MEHAERHDPGIMCLFMYFVNKTHKSKGKIVPVLN